MCYADTAATQADYDRFYAECSKYQDPHTGTGGGTTPGDAERLHDTAVAIAQLVPPTARVLDIGCVNGGLLEALADIGFVHLAGVDPSPGCVANTRRLIPGVQAEAGFLSRLPFSQHKFDLVILSHVLEHVRDMPEAMGAVRETVADGGMLYLEVPDAARYAQHVAAPYQDFNTEHINHFSLLALRNLAAVHGFEPTQMGAKTIPSPPPIPFPAVFGFFRKTATVPAGAIEPDAGLRERLAAYIIASAELLRRIDGRLRAVLARSPEVIVWGTGQLALKLLTETALRDARIAALIDGNPINHGKVLRGVTIRGPDGVAGLPHPIVITTTLHHRAISEAIRTQHRYPNEIVILAD
jgi:SAM-dependent methyltransferase